MEMTKEEEDYYFRTPYAKHAFEGKTAVVTGAGSGMGRATACLLAACGCTVALVDLNSVGLDDTRAMIIARARSLIIVYACTAIIVSARTMIILQACNYYDHTACMC